MDVEGAVASLQRALQEAVAARDALERKVHELVKANQALYGALAGLARAGEEWRPSPARGTKQAAAVAVEPPAPVVVLLEATLDLLLAVLGLDMGAIWLAPHRVSRGLPEGAIWIGEAVGAAGLAIPSIQAVADWEAVGEVHPELAPLRETMGRLGVRASIAASLDHEGRTGGLAVAAPQPRTWTGTEIAFVESVAHVLRVAIQSALGKERRESEERYRQLVDKPPSGEIVGVCGDVTERKKMEGEIRRQAARADALLRTAARLNAQLDLDHVLKVVCEETRAALDAPVAAVMLLDDKRDVLYLAAGSGLPQGLAERMGPLPRALHDEYVGQMGAVVVIPDLGAIPDLPFSDLCRDYDLRTYAGVSMQREGALVGVLAVATVGEVRRFAADELALLQGLADQAAQALVNARLFSETRRRLKLVQALRNIDMAIAGSLDLRVTFSVALDEITAQLDMDAAAILLLNLHTQTLEYAAWRGFRTKAPERVRVRLGEGYAGRAALERRTIHVPNLSAAAGASAQALLLAGEGFVAYYAVPLIAKGRIQGVLEVFHRAPLEPDGEWLEFLETLAEQAAIAIDNVALFDQVQRSHVELILAYDATIEGWSRALDLRDRETEGHTQRVTEMTLRLARALGVKEEDLVHVRRGALLHDIGKLGVPDSILLKPGPLTPQEWQIMRRHPQYAYEMLSPIAYLRPALDVPYCHHEKWDGTGYPRGLKGEQIPLAARIFAVVDVWDALSSDRPYRRAWPPEKVRAYLEDQAGKHFDPRVVEAFLRELGSA